jgi:hypothetical protein
MPTLTICFLAASAIVSGPMDVLKWTSVSAEPIKLYSSFAAQLGATVFDARAKQQTT